MQPRLIGTFDSEHVRGRVICGDALDFLRLMDSACADLIFLDPPFNLGKTYGEKGREHDRRPEPDYHDWLTRIVLECVRVLTPGGALYLYHLPRWAMRLGAIIEEHLRFRHWIAISMKNGFVRGQSLYPAHYALLYFTKGAPLRFRRPKVAPSSCRHCGKIIKDYGGYWPIIERRGLNLSDFWEDLSPVRHRNRKNRTANELPELLFGRVMEISGAPDMLYVDPFAGAGSGVISAVKAGLRFECCDLEEPNCSIIAERLSRIGCKESLKEVAP